MLDTLIQFKMSCSWETCLRLDLVIVILLNGLKVKSLYKHSYRPRFLSVLVKQAFFSVGSSQLEIHNL